MNSASAIFISCTEVIMQLPQIVIVKKEKGLKGLQKYQHNASAVAIAVGENTYLRTK